MSIGQVLFRRQIRDSHKKAQKAQNDFVLIFVPYVLFCGLNFVLVCYGKW
jgi:hypothetical protein